MKAFEICIPAIEEQERIAAALEVRLERVESARTRVVHEANTIDALPQAIFRRAFAGEL